MDDTLELVGNRRVVLINKDGKSPRHTVVTSSRPCLVPELQLIKEEKDEESSFLK